MDATLLTPEQVAHRLNITLNTTYVWLREGRLPGVRLGRRWRVRQEAQEAFLDSVTPQASREPADATRVLDFIAELTKDIPPEAWECLPEDGAANHDYYLYGARKQEQP